jgi:hypothetical protein
MKSVEKRHLLIGAMATVLVMLRVLAPSEDSALPDVALVRPTVRLSGDTPAPADVPAVKGRVSSEALPEALNVRTRDVVKDVPDLFHPVSWYVAAPEPKPVATAPLPTPAPTAPSLPFQFLGKYAEGGRELLILSRANRVLTVEPGDVIAETYRLDSSTETDIQFTYLPMNIKQLLSTETNNAIR